MEGIFRALGWGSKPEYAEKIPETLKAGDFYVHKVSCGTLGRLCGRYPSDERSPVAMWMWKLVQVALGGVAS